MKRRRSAGISLSLLARSLSSISSPSTHHRAISSYSALLLPLSRSVSLLTPSASGLRSQSSCLPSLKGKKTPNKRKALPKIIVISSFGWMFQPWPWPSTLSWFRGDVSRHISRPQIAPRSPLIPTAAFSSHTAGRPEQKGNYVSRYSRGVCVCA